MSANAVTDPKAVMIKALDANLAFFAVFCSVITSYFTYLAKNSLRFRCINERRLRLLF